MTGSKAKGPCAVEGCANQARNAGLCSKHYERKRVHGSTEYRPQFENLLGRRFGRLVVVGATERSAANQVRWKCSCDCGVVTDVQASNLNSGHTQSCGCLQPENARAKARTHGQTKTPTYRSWTAMRRRCGDPKYIQFHLYGGRGISVCARWTQSFENFLADMGERPIGTSLDRINNDGNYEPGNCRWATAVQQAANRRKRN